MRALSAISLPGAQRRRLRHLAGLCEGVDTRVRPVGRLLGLLDRRPRTTATYTGLIGALTIGGAFGPIAALGGGVYAATAVTLWASMRRSQAERRASALALDVVAGIAADLRVGADPEAVVSNALPVLRGSGRHGALLADRIAAACRVAEAVGARLADLLDRLESDARGLTKAQATAAAQAAGAQATAWLLAGLPVAGLALGYGIGANPVHVLLHTKIGAGCAVAAIAFQVVGLAWSQRLTRSINEAVQ